jgi:hypothetical protein
MVWEWWAKAQLNWPSRWELGVILAGRNGYAPLYPVIKQDIATGAGLGGAVGRRAKAQELLRFLGTVAQSEAESVLLTQDLSLGFDL